MPRTRTLVLVLAGGAGGRLGLLTERRAKPAVAFAGTHRLIDFPLSNCLNAGIGDVWISQQYNAVSLSDHVANGRPWDLDRTTGGLLILHPREGDDVRSGFPRGTADALWRDAPLIREFAPEALVVVSADAVYKLDYAALVDQHRETGADATITTAEVEPGDASRYGVVETSTGRITDYVYKPDEPASNVISTEVFVFKPERVLDELEQLDERADLGDELLPRLVAQGSVREHRMDGHWRDVGTIPAYWGSHMELVADEPPIDLDDPDWPILTSATSHRGAAQVLSGAELRACRLAPGARVGGTVERTVVGRGAVVEAGATVRESVLLPGSIVRAGATVERAIVDETTEVGAPVRGEGEEIALVGAQADQR